MRKISGAYLGTSHCALNNELSLLPINLRMENEKKLLRIHIHAARSGIESIFPILATSYMKGRLGVDSV